MRSHGATCAPDAAAGLRYRPEVDGLRAVAVVPVILFHAGFGWFAGGYVGVDVFFVISGYLITSILVEDLGRGRFSIARFYERRARRILPALFLVLLCTSIAGWLSMVPEQFENYSRTLVAVVLFASNIHFWRTEDYFAPAAELNPLLHTWSLAVEEQFYIFFPLLLLLLWRFGAGRTLRALILLSLGSLLLAEWSWRNAPTPAFFLLPTRAWELGAGALCAFILRDAPPRANALLAGAGLGLIAFAVIAYDAATPFPSVYALAPVAGAALVILYGRTGTLPARLLSLRPVVGIGLVSYSAYLWHQPLFAFSRIRSLDPPGTGLMLALALASLLLAFLTWRLVEQPFRRRPVPLLASRPAVFAASGIAAVGLAAIGAYGILTDGRQRAWIAANPDEAEVYALHATAKEVEGVYLDDGACRFNVPAIDAATVERLRACRDRHGPGVAIFGDSHASDFFNGMSAAYDGAFVFGMTLGGCWMQSRSDLCDFEGFASLLRDNRGIFDLVLYHQAGYRYFESPDGETGPELLGSIPEQAEIRREDFRIADERIASGLVYLRELAAFAPVLWVGPRIEPHIRLGHLLRGGCAHDYALRPGQARLFRDLDRRLAGASAAAGIPYASLIEATRFDMATDFMTCDELYWRDGDHWSAAGAERFVRRFLAAAAPELRSEIGRGTRVR